jgi:hypothetical protein
MEKPPSASDRRSESPPPPPLEEPLPARDSTCSLMILVMPDENRVVSVPPPTLPMVLPDPVPPCEKKLPATAPLPSIPRSPPKRADLRYGAPADQTAKAAGRSYVASRTADAALDAISTLALPPVLEGPLPLPATASTPIPLPPGPYR